MLNLPDPPGFKALDPECEVRLSRRHLPHWHQDGATCFVTFRTADSIPAAKLHELDLLARSLAEIPEAERSRFESIWRTQMSLLYKFLDEGHGACPLRDSLNSEIVANAMRHFDGDRYALFAYVVMPNHLHALICPKEGFELGAILKSWKTFTARRINERLGKSGKFWQAESYDRIVRDSEELYRVVQYIGKNGEKAGLGENEYRRWICSRWEGIGWGFDG